MTHGSRRRFWPKNQTSNPTGWLRMRVWRMSLRRAKSTIISRAGSITVTVWYHVHSVKKGCYAWVNMFGNTGPLRSGKFKSCANDETGDAFHAFKGWTLSFLFILRWMLTSLDLVVYRLLFYKRVKCRRLPLCQLRESRYYHLCRSDFSFQTYFFAFQLRLCRKRLTWSNWYLEVIFSCPGHIFYYICYCLYRSQKSALACKILFASALYMYHLRCKHLPFNNKTWLK